MGESSGAGGDGGGSGGGGGGGSVAACRRSGAAQWVVEEADLATKRAGCACTSAQRGCFGQATLPGSLHWLLSQPGMCAASTASSCSADNERKRTYKTKAETEAKKPVTATIVGTLLFISGAPGGCGCG